MVTHFPLLSYHDDIHPEFLRNPKMYGRMPPQIVPVTKFSGSDPWAINFYCQKKSTFEPDKRLVERFTGLFNKKLSYHRETALQGWLVYGQKLETETGRQYLRTIFNNATYLASREIEIGEKTQNKGCYAAQGHPRSSLDAYLDAYN